MSTVIGANSFTQFFYYVGIYYSYSIVCFTISAIPLV